LLSGPGLAAVAVATAQKKCAATSIFPLKLDRDSSICGVNAPQKTQQCGALRHYLLLLLLLLLHKKNTACSNLLLLQSAASGRHSCRPYVRSR